MEADPQDKPRVRGQALATLRLIAACLLCAVGLMAVFKAPTDALWKPTIAVTEAGHFLAILAAALLLGRQVLRRSRMAFGVALLALCLLLSPALRSWMSAGSIAQAIDSAFPTAAPTTTDSPFSPTALWQMDTPKVGVERLLFSPEHNLHLDFYAPKDASGVRPLVIVIHGGAWARGDSDQLPAINHHLAGLGYGVAAVNYRKAPAHPFPAARDDVLAAVDFFKKHGKSHGVDPTRIVLVGRSAGAQLALIAGYGARDPAIRGVVDIYGACDLAWSWANPANPLLIDTHQVLTDFLGGPPDAFPKQYKDASPLEIVHSGAPPTLLLHGGRDGLVSDTHSVRLAVRLGELGVRHAFVGMPWATHGFDANLYGPSGQPYVFALERFLGAVLPLEQATP